jgi:hypothetical protein
VIELSSRVGNITQCPRTLTTSCTCRITCARSIQSTTDIVVAFHSPWTVSVLCADASQRHQRTSGTFEIVATDDCIFGKGENQRHMGYWARPLSPYLHPVAHRVLSSQYASKPPQIPPLHRESVHWPSSVHGPPKG